MSFIYAHLPCGYEGPSNLLRSIPHPPQKAYVRFLNITNTYVDVMWVDFDGQLKLYRTLGPNAYFDCDTFVDHLWVFKESDTNDAMFVDHKEIFWPKAYFISINENQVPKRVIVRIRRPVLSLLTLAARAVRDRLKNIIEPFYLEIPFHLQCLVAKLILDVWHSLPERRTILPFPINEDSILKKDLDDFQYNIMFFSYRLSMHAKKLMTVSKKMSGRGKSVLLIRHLLKSAITFLGFELTYDFPEQYSRKLGPTIWKQMIFLRIHYDNLKMGAGAALNQPAPSDPYATYTRLLTLPMRRLQLMLDDQKKSLHQYHWEQLSLLVGNSELKNSEKIKNDSEAYGIPELTPLSERQEWEWVTVRRKQFTLYPDKQMMSMFIGLTGHLIRLTDKLENIFQVLCFCHYHLFGHHITEEVITDEMETKETGEVCSNSQPNVRQPSVG